MVFRGAQEAFVGELGSVVEGVSGGAAELAVAVLQALLLQRLLGFQHLGFGGFQRVVQTAQHGEGQDDFLELAFLESAVEQIGDGSEEADDGVEFSGFVHGIRSALGKGVDDRKSAGCWTVRKVAAASCRCLPELCGGMQQPLLFFARNQRWGKVGRRNEEG